MQEHNYSQYSPYRKLSRFLDPPQLKTQSIWFVFAQVRGKGTHPHYLYKSLVTLTVLWQHYCQLLGCKRNKVYNESCTVLPVVLSHLFISEFQFYTYTISDYLYMNYIYYIHFSCYYFYYILLVSKIFPGLELTILKLPYDLVRWDPRQNCYCSN